MLKRDTTAIHVGSEMIVPHLAPAPKVTPQKLKRAAQLSKQIDSLRKQLTRILTGAGQ